MSSITFDPYIPLALWVPLALGRRGAAGMVCRGRAPPPAGAKVVGRGGADGGGGGRAAGVLLNPTWLERIPPPAGKPLLTVAGRPLGQHGHARRRRRQDPLSGRRRAWPRPWPGSSAAGTKCASARSPKPRRPSRSKTLLEARGPTGRRPTWPPPCKTPRPTTSRRARRCCC